MEFWSEQVLAMIGNSIGRHLGVARDTMEGSMAVYARICVEMNLSQPLPAEMEIELVGLSWIQQLDYEALPFRCRVCHKHGHLAHFCPNNMNAKMEAPSGMTNLPKEDKATLKKDSNSTVQGQEVQREGFEQPKRKRRIKKREEKEQSHLRPANRYEIFKSLVDEEEQFMEGMEGNKENSNIPVQLPLSSPPVIQ